MGGIKMKKLIAFILCVAMIFGGAVSSFGADKAIGSTIKLTKTSGTVSVEARNGKA